MERRTVRRIFCLGALACVLTLCACGGLFKKETSEPKESPGVVLKKELGISIERIGVLDAASIESRLPRMVGSGGEAIDLQCFERIVNLETKEIAGPKTTAALQTEASAINTAALRWLFQNLMPEGTDPQIMAGWKSKYEGAVVTHLNPADLKLTPGQTCIDEDSRAFRQDAAAVIALFGAKVFHFRSKKPFDRSLLSAMRNAAAQDFILFEHQELFYPATDDQGNPVLGPGGDRMFVTPKGSLAPEGQIPPPDQRPVMQIRLSFNNGPLFFAYGNLPADVWKQEADESQCNLHLVFEDVTPRVPECVEFEHAGFGVSRGAIEGTLLVKVAASDATVAESVPVNETKMIQAGGQVLVWVKPQPLEEGAFLAVDSLVLDLSEETPKIPRAFENTPKKKKKKKKKK